MTDTTSAALNCRHCQQSFESHKHNQQFCSDACRGKHFRQYKRAKSAPTPTALPPLPPPPRQQPPPPPEGVNLDWLNQQHRTARQEQRYWELERQVEALARQMKAITQQESWREWGVVGGGFLALMLITLLAQHQPTSSKRGTLWLWLVLLGAVLALGGYQLGGWLGQDHLRTDPAQQQQLASLRQRLTDTALLRDQQLEGWQASEAILEAIPKYERTATASGAKAPVDGDIAPALAAEEDILEQP